MEVFGAFLLKHPGGNNSCSYNIVTIAVVIIVTIAVVTIVTIAAVTIVTIAVDVVTIATVHSK